MTTMAKPPKTEARIKDIENRLLASPELVKLIDEFDTQTTKRQRLRPRPIASLRHLRPGSFRWTST